MPSAANRQTVVDDLENTLDAIDTFVYSKIMGEDIDNNPYMPYMPHIIDALKNEFGLIVWGYQKTTPEEFIAFLFGPDMYWKTWATGELLLHGSWKLIIEILGLDEVVTRWKDVKEMYAENRFTRRMYLDIGWVCQYVKSTGAGK